MSTVGGRTGESTGEWYRQDGDVGRHPVDVPVPPQPGDHEGEVRVPVAAGGKELPEVVACVHISCDPLCPSSPSRLREGLVQSGT